MNNPLATRDFDHLEKCLENLEITVFENNDGCLTVCTTSEPLFCFVRETQEEIDAVVVDTLTSYVKTFFQVENVSVEAEQIPLVKPTVPHHQLRPIARIRPSFAAPAGGSLAFAF